jgi:hypothetical protein
MSNVDISEGFFKNYNEVKISFFYYCTFLKQAIRKFPVF